MTGESGCRTKRCRSARSHSVCRAPSGLAGGYNLATTRSTCTDLRLQSGLGHCERLEAMGSEASRSDLCEAGRGDVLEHQGGCNIAAPQVWTRPER
jgi:hypothetical protein